MRERLVVLPIPTPALGKDGLKQNEHTTTMEKINHSNARFGQRWIETMAKRLQLVLPRSYSNARFGQRWIET